MPLDKVFLKLFNQIDDAYENIETADTVPIYTPFVEQKKVLIDLLCLALIPFLIYCMQT